MADHTSMDVGAAESAARGMAEGAGGYAAAVERLRTGIAAVGPVGAEGSELGGVLAEFTERLIEVAGRAGQAYGSAAAGVSASAGVLRAADGAARVRDDGGSWA